MKIAIFGTGYVGLVTGTCLAELGNDVVCIDIDKQKIENLKQDILPIYEPGLEELVKRNQSEGRLVFSTDGPDAIQASDLIFIAVGTPPNEQGEVDMQYVYEVAKTIGANLNGYKIIVNKSTVPVGTADTVKNAVIEACSDSNCEFSMVSNPEFLKEGSAVRDFMVPDRIIVGTEPDDNKAIDAIREVYRPLERTGQPIMFTDIKSAEIIKYASNAMLATRISFMNELSHLCEAMGGDIKVIAKGIGLDKRIGSRFLQAGVGYGGSCFPKDAKALSHILKQAGCDSRLIDAVEAVNAAQKKSLFPKIHQLLGDDLSGKTVAVMGLAFKPKTDDMREAPSIEIVQYLNEKGAKIQAFDPVAMSNARKTFEGLDVDYKKNPYDAVTEADLAIFVTEWNEFRMIDLSKIASLMNSKNIIDGRNILDPSQAAEHGFNYISVGREQWAQA